MARAFSRTSFEPNLVIFLSKVFIFHLTAFSLISRLKWPKVGKSVNPWLYRDYHRCCVGTHQLRLTTKDGSRSRQCFARTSKSPGAATSTSRLSRVNPC